MLKNYIRIALRNLFRQRFFTALNVLGLSLGIAGGLLLFQFIRFHLSFDRYHAKADQLYRVVLELHLDDGTVEYEQGSPLPIAEALQKELPEVRDHAVIQEVPAYTVEANHHLYKEQNTFAFADPHWFNLFDNHWLEGNAATSLNEPHTAVITQRLAKKYFGNTPAMGRTLRLDDSLQVTITGILTDNPPNTDQQIDGWISRASFGAFYPSEERGMEDSWSWMHSTTQSYVWLPNGLPAAKVAAAMDRLTRAHFDKSVVKAYQFHLQPLNEVHFDARFSGTMQLSLLWTLGIVAAALVVIACFNFVNLATAQSTRRSREVGTRKVLGGTAAAIFWQFITETAVLVLFSAALSLVWVHYSLPLFHQWMQTELPFSLLHDRQLAGFLLGLTGFVIIAAGFYPAMVLSRWQPVHALKNQVSGGGSLLLRKGLILVQHVVVQVLLICTLVIALQTHYIKNADPGFDKNAVMLVPIPNKDAGQQAFLAQQLRQLRGVSDVSFCFRAPLSDKKMAGSISYDNRPWEAFVARTLLGDDHYLTTFRLQLLAGRNLAPSDTAREGIINEDLLHRFGFRDPSAVIGHRVVIGQLGDQPCTIVGVVKDFNVHPLYTQQEPAVITTLRSRYEMAAVKVSGLGAGASSGESVREAVQRVWQRVYPDKVFEYHFLDETIDTYYHKEDLLSRLINTTALVAILISCLGLTGLIAYFAVLRTKEIGIRKVLGASVAGIVFLLSKDFLKIALWSLLVAVPLAWYCMHRWLEGFAYRVGLQWWVFALPALASVLIALVTVGVQAMKAAVVNPVESLKAE